MPLPSWSDDPTAWERLYIAGALAAGIVCDINVVCCRKVQKCAGPVGQLRRARSPSTSAGAGRASRPRDGCDGLQSHGAGEGSLGASAIGASPPINSSQDFAASQAMYAAAA